MILVEHLNTELASRPNYSLNLKGSVVSLLNLSLPIPPAYDVAETALRMLTDSPSGPLVVVVSRSAPSDGSGEVSVVGDAVLARRFFRGGARLVLEVKFGLSSSLSLDLSFFLDRPGSSSSPPFPSPLGPMTAFNGLLTPTALLPRAFAVVLEMERSAP